MVINIVYCLYWHLTEKNVNDGGLCMKKKIEDHPVISSIFLSLIASAIYTLGLEPIIKEINQLKIFELTIGINFLKNQPFSFQVNLITIIFFSLVVICLVASITYFVMQSRTQKKIKESLPNDNYCNECENVKTLTEANNDKQKQYDELLSEYQHALPYKKLTDSLNEYFDNTEVMESIQLFLSPKLPTIEEANTMEEINIPLQFVSGKAKTFSNTNALLNINYKFEKTIYHDIKKLFDLRNKYYSNNNKQRDPSTEKDIQKDALELFNKIQNGLDNIKSISDITDTDYASYKLLEILANVVIGDKALVSCDRMLQSENIELQLKYGQRTGMLGAIFTESLYCFYNENSLTKKDRMYFSVPISYKQKHLILLGICNKNDLKVPTNCDYVKCCEQLYEGIRKVLNKTGV